MIENKLAGCLETDCHSRRDGTAGNERASEGPKGTRQSLLGGGVVQLVRTPVTQEVAGSSPVAPATFHTEVKLLCGGNARP
jgi:hypothetical protein